MKVNDAILKQIQEYLKNAFEKVADPTADLEVNHQYFVVDKLHREVWKKAQTFQSYDDIYGEPIAFTVDNLGVVGMPYLRYSDFYKATNVGVLPDNLFLQPAAAAGEGAVAGAGAPAAAQGANQQGGRKRKRKQTARKQRRVQRKRRSSRKN